MAFPSVCAAARISPRLLNREASARGIHIFVRIFAHCMMAPLLSSARDLPTYSGRRRRRRRRRRGEGGKEARGIAGGGNRQDDHDDDDDDISCNARGWLEPRDSVKPCSHLNYLVGGEKSREVGGSLCCHAGVDAEVVVLVLLLVVVKTKCNRLPAILNLRENKLISLRDSSCCCCRCTDASRRGSLPRPKNNAMAIAVLGSRLLPIFSA
ncbi:unnamed protein product [Trichogramma brassicae]|uniref:Uncharacterized protein n=1 Tax=Trichogramma brassicae TaxID=86971 RepID=A0A6H5JA87_9HYME|nr:unnamed protein product [Trichogramma brassicae]